MKKLLVAVFAFSAMCLASCNSGGGDPKVVLTGFFDAMAKKDFAAARKLATADSKPTFDLMETAMKMNESMADEQVKEKYDKSKMEIGEPKIDGDKATVNVKETKSGESVNFTLKKESGAWKVAMDMGTMMGMAAEKMNEKGMHTDTDDTVNLKEQMDKFKNMSADSLKMMMNKGMEALDSLKKAMDKK